MTSEYCAAILLVLVPTADAAKKKKAPTTSVYGLCGVGGKRTRTSTTGRKRVLRKRYRLR